jgi:DNA polymerase III sliding clamp (beta) subunit (PCNA family)
VLWFRTKHTSIFARRMGADYPGEPEAMLTGDKDAKQFTLAFGAKLIEMLERTDSFAEEAQGKRPMELSVSEGQLRCKTKDAEGAKYEEWQKVDDVPEFAISIDARHLLDLAKQSKQGAKVSCELSADKLWIRTEDWEYVCLLLPL